MRHVRIMQLALLVLVVATGAACGGGSTRPTTPAADDPALDAAKADDPPADAAKADDPPANPARADDPAVAAAKALDEMAAIKDEICKCSDMACAEPLGMSMEPLNDKLKELYPDKRTVPADLMARGEQIEQDLIDCVSRLID